MTTVGEALVQLLEAYHVDTVFGIPGVHTIELYRGLARSSIRHITPRHEQGAGFMADGYARATGKPGVAFVITGPGITNTITAMGQARADSVPMLVISGVNQRDSLGKGMGFLHELPNQRAMLQTVAMFSHRIETPGELPIVLARAFALFASRRPGPVHIEIPLDVMALPLDGARRLDFDAPLPQMSAETMAELTRLCATAEQPLILIGGGAKGAAAEIAQLAERLGAPVVSTTNARGIMYGHPLIVPASASLKAVRNLIAESDLVIGIGTEMGPTDYDMYGDGGFPAMKRFVRIDIDAAQLDRWPAFLPIEASAQQAVSALLAAIPDRRNAVAGEKRAAKVREAAWAELSPRTRAHVGFLNMLRDTLPGSLIVGDSTQTVYSGNMYFDHDRVGGWFNAATGFGALGFGPPAAIGAALGRPEAATICLVGDGGFQFVLGELGAAIDEDVPVIFIVWNNNGYQEIERAMVEVDIEPVGVRPSPPDYLLIAQAYGIEATRLASIDELPEALSKARAAGKPCLIEIEERLVG
ncbi:5-guanidino-2-oxopentanoate decarboxylase [Phyllobacterium sp. 0TCS1.6C]|uniref:5-guanidino-2-oxopentanoate decarboxylase n=1 Tax=unclassified Phyllobacterium TaxID=2638441 RepID=UPI002263FDCB|nr:MULTISPECIES: 5-guanidino-2-oxopentanoate decarboxylase [unclassified Phyllobacterium]MCX8280766.1 5-guanidino-2-oxopentanoate decarboxylase [Phyllobacterium sp. 0TCS1.6C]MCX8292657.1 5-guanidino-2-oxopentanoate decarboxylase [Phyllobacterium sp. 0TCS1.6A]